MNNALKHAQAGRIRIRLGQRDDAIVLAIEDNGTGMPLETQKGGMGMRTMKQRAIVAGGTLAVRPAAGGGTLVECIIPIDEQPV